MCVWWSMFHNGALMRHILSFCATEAAIKVNGEVGPAYFTKLAATLFCFLLKLEVGIVPDNFLCTQCHITLYESHFHSTHVNTSSNTLGKYFYTNCHQTMKNPVLAIFPKIPRGKFEFSLKLSSIIIFLSHVARAAYIVISNLRNLSSLPLNILFFCLFPSECYCYFSKFSEGIAVWP